MKSALPDGRIDRLACVVPGDRLGLSREGRPTLVLVVTGLIDRLACVVPGVRLGLSREGRPTLVLVGLVI